MAPLPRFALLEMGMLAVALIALAGQFQRDLSKTKMWVQIVLVAGVSLYVLSFFVGHGFGLV